MLLDRDCHLEIYFGRIMSRRMEIFVYKLKYSGQNTQFNEIYKFQYNDNDLCENITGPSIPMGLLLNQSELPLTS
jgi:hypothetical protein